MKDYKEHHRHARIEHNSKITKEDVIEIAKALILFGLMYLLLTIVFCF